MTDPNICGENNDTALHVAAESGMDAVSDLDDNQNIRKRLRVRVRILMNGCSNIDDSCNKILLLFAFDPHVTF